MKAIMVYIMKNKHLHQVVGIVVFVIGAISFIVGAHESNNCSYDSIASRINLGYIIGCELFEPRFRGEPICSDKIIKAIATQNDYYRNGYRTVYFEDGTSHDMWVLDDISKMIGMKTKVCEDQ